jgi:hypothetical protein
LGDIAAQIQNDAEAQKPCNDLVDQALAEFERVKETLATLKA